MRAIKLRKLFALQSLPVVIQISIVTAQLISNIVHYITNCPLSIIRCFIAFLWLADSIDETPLASLSFMNNNYLCYETISELYAPV